MNHVGVCITVQIGERGTFTDVQIAERGKQRVKGKSVTFASTLNLHEISSAGGFWH